MKTYFIKTFGCQMNESDSERIATLLEQEGLKSVSKITKADLAIFTTCGVRQTAEDRVYGQIHNLRKEKPDSTIVVTGCLAHRKDVKRKLQNKVDYFIPAKKLSQLGIILGLQPEKTCRQTFEENDYLKIMPKYKYTDTAFVPIMTGCNNFCTYCVVPYARGREWSRSLEEIFKEVNGLAQSGCKEITLLGQNVNSYRFTPQQKDGLLGIKGLALDKTKTVNFPILLTILANNFPGVIFKFLTSHPKDFSERLIEVIAKYKNIAKEIHLPIQSGSDGVLKAMNRGYTQKHYLEIIKKIKDLIPKVKLSTDVIVGFPGETWEDFQQTVKVFKAVRYHTAFTNKYSPRPGTAAEKLADTIPWEEKKRRERILRKLF